MLFTLGIATLIFLHQSYIVGRKKGPCFHLHFYCLLFIIFIQVFFFFLVMIQKWKSFQPWGDETAVLCSRTARVNRGVIGPVHSVSCSATAPARHCLLVKAWSVLINSVSVEAGVQRISGQFDPACQNCLLITMRLKTCTWAWSAVSPPPQLPPPTCLSFLGDGDLLIPQQKSAYMTSNPETTSAKPSFESSTCRGCSPHISGS